MTSACVSMVTKAEEAGQNVEPQLYSQFASQMNVADIEEKVKQSMREEFAKINV